MSSEPEAPTRVIRGGGDAASPNRRMFNNCWGCRVLCGGGLVAAAGYVFMCSRRGIQRQGSHTTPGYLLQLMFSYGLAALGMVVITDPTSQRVTKT